MRKFLLTAAAMTLLPLTANAQYAAMYPQHTDTTYTSPGYAVTSSNQVMRLPPNYQSSSATTSAYRDPYAYPAQRPAYQPAPARASMETLDASPSMMPGATTVAAAPSTVLPDGTLLVPDNSSVTTTTTTTITSEGATTPTPLVTNVSYVPAIAPTTYEVRQTTATYTTDDQDDVSLKDSCGDQLNHRSRNKAVNTSTTVQSDCLD